ncbi:MAG: hypothetical protein ACJAVL_000379 [Bacteroidia bacterium]|jgi:hypothetical protein
MMKKLLQNLLPVLFVFTALTASAQIVLIVESPSPLSGSYDFTYADSWAADMDTIGITAEAAFAVDGSATEDSLACGNIVNAVDIDGKIAVLYRGECEFSAKAKNVQDAGAIACIIINNIPGAPVAMGGGVLADDVFIPVAMLTNTDGALLRQAIIDGDVTIYLGNNTGVFAYNIGTSVSEVILPKNTAIPTTFVQTQSTSISVGMWSFNFGNQEATGVTGGAVIEKDGSEVYNETSTSVNIPVTGDSAYFSFPEYLTSDEGYYTLTYTLEADSTDEYSLDNEIILNFWINSAGYFSISRINPDEGSLYSGATRSAPAAGAEFAPWEWCTVMRVPDENDLQANGVSFATITDDTLISLVGKSAFLKFYEWNDVGETFNDLNELTSNEIYDYTEDARFEYVTHMFDEPIDLVAGQKYLSCIWLDDEEMFLAYDAELDYALNFDEAYPGEAISPLFTYETGDETVFLLGFAGAIPAFATIMSNPNGIAENVEELSIKPYPNPTTDMINIPLGEINGNIELKAYDMGGRLVLNQEICQKNSNLIVDVTSLKSGLHTFNLTFEDDSRTSFQVVVTK